ncbi:MAG: PilZ domain-containing protein [bacterium]|nr:PilZ domain-containing protein [bacterium]
MDKIKFKTADIKSVLKHAVNSDDFNEQRKCARLDLPLKVRYKLINETGGSKNVNELSVAAKNISVNGCLLLTTENIPINSRVQLEILLDEFESAVLTLEGRIVRLERTESGLYEFGILFDAVNKDARRIFADFCFSKMYEMVGLNAWPTDNKEKKI